MNPMCLDMLTNCFSNKHREDANAQDWQEVGDLLEKEGLIEYQEDEAGRSLASTTPRGDRLIKDLCAEMGSFLEFERTAYIGPEMPRESGPHPYLIVAGCDCDYCNRLRQIKTERTEKIANLSSQGDQNER